MSHRSLRPKFRSKGAIAVEFGLVVTILIPLIVGTVEIGRMLYAYDALTKSVRSAARYLSVAKAPFGEAPGPASATLQSAAKCIVVTGSPGLTGSGAGAACANSPQLPGLNTSMVSILEPGANAEVQNINTGAGQISVVTVAVTSYPLSQLTTILFPSLALANISVTVPLIFF